MNTSNAQSNNQQDICSIQMSSQSEENNQRIGIQQETSNKVQCTINSELQGKKNNTYQMSIPANYELIDGESVTQSEFCQVIVFNKDSSVMIVGCGRFLKVFRFNLGKLEETQLINEDINFIFSLQFINSSNEFVTGSYDHSIQIWAYNENQKYYCKQWLKDAHSDIVTCVKMNKNEDMIISSSEDTSIKIWTKKIEWECSETFKDHTKSVLCISLNESSNQLVSGGNDAIRIRQLCSDQKWRVIQRITLDYKSRLCFVGDNLITLKRINAEKMEIFKLNKKAKLFVKSKDVKIDKFSFGSWKLSQQQFNQKQQIFLYQNGETLYLMRVQNGEDIVIEQTIKFGTQYAYGALTDDGKYLVTWDDNSQQFKVREQQKED